MRIIAYTYMADVHCPSCTEDDFDKGLLRINDRHPHAILPPSWDEHQMPINTQDRERNLIRPVFSTDERNFTHCGDCGSKI